MILCKKKILHNSKKKTAHAAKFRLLSTKQENKILQNITGQVQKRKQNITKHYWTLSRRYMADEILPIRRKTHQSINQSINQLDDIGYVCSMSIFPYFGKKKPPKMFILFPYNNVDILSVLEKHV